MTEQQIKDVCALWADTIRPGRDLSGLILVNNHAEKQFVSGVVRQYFAESDIQSHVVSPSTITFGAQELRVRTCNQHSIVLLSYQFICAIEIELTYAEVARRRLRNPHDPTQPLTWIS